MAIIQMIFDAHCLLCSGFVNFILKHESGPDIVFINAGSQTGLDIAGRHGLTEAGLNETYLVVTDGKPLLRSDAAFAIMAQLKAPWPVFRILRFTPRLIRDGIYSLVARNRYQWFGRSDICYLPALDEKHRFIL